MRVLHVTSSLMRGGAEAMLVELILGSREYGIENHVIYFHEGPHVATLQEAGIPLYRVQGVVSLYDPFMILCLAKLVRQIKPDLIHSLLWLANTSVRWVARRQDIPFIAALHNNLDQNGSLRTFIDRMTIHDDDRFIAVSPGVRDSFCRELPRCATNRVDVIRNGLDGDSIRERCVRLAKCRSDIGLLPEHLVIGSVGRWEQVKNYPLLIMTFARLAQKHDHARLLLVGTGSQALLLRQRARELGIGDKVIFIEGQLGYGYYPIFDFFASSSPKEGVSIALLEAMNMGLPCVVTSIDGSHAVLEDGLTGIVSPTQDADVFARAFEPLLTDAAHGRLLGSRGYEFVREQFSLSAMIAAYINVYKQLLNNHQ